MNPRADIWNVLHDGGIAGIEGEIPGDLTLRIRIPYLSQMLSDGGEDILLRLCSCTRFAMTIGEEDRLAEDLQRIAASGAEILSTESEDIPIRIVTTQGEIDTEFQSFTLALDDGRSISFEELCDACERYWTRWEEKAKARRNKGGQDRPGNSQRAGP